MVYAFIAALPNPFEETNPFKFLFKGFLYIYQRFITTQDNQECQFNPSCSAFAVKALEISGPIQALLMTADRVQRCNPFAHYYYRKTPDGLYLYDPPERHKLWGKGSVKKLYLHWNNQADKERK
ncbi:MAG: membrane protein insertion efficiency factor YidD [bacterium]